MNRAPLAPDLPLLAELGDLAEIVDTSTLTRALYSSDASLYRVAPTAVARPRTADELMAELSIMEIMGHIRRDSGNIFAPAIRQSRE